MHAYADTFAFAVDTTAPELPAEVAAMVAPPVTVTAGPAARPPARPPRVELLLYRTAVPEAESAGRHRRRAS